MSLAKVEALLRDVRIHRPGIVVGATVDGASRTWHRGDLPDGETTVFEIGSVTKTFTALLLADLALAGVVALDDPVSRHLPVAPPVVGRPITLEDLASHHSGLPRLPKGTAWTGTTSERHDPYARFDEATLSDAIRRTTPRRAPGQRFTYSNLGAGMLGWALARAAGTTYDDLVAQRITGPLALTDTGLSTPADQRHRLAQGHGWFGGETGTWDLALLAGAGGLRSTVPDLLRYLAIFAEGAGGPLAAAAAETRIPVHSVGRLEVGLGWLLMPDGVLFHDGGTGGYRSFAAVDPASGAAVAVLTSQARGVTSLGIRIVRALTG